MKPGGRIAIIDKNAEHWGTLRNARVGKMVHPQRARSASCAATAANVSSRFISYWEDVEPDGLFLAWLAEK